MTRINQNHSNAGRSLIRGTKNQAAKNQNKSDFLKTFLENKGAETMDFLTYKELIELNVAIGQIDKVAQGVSGNDDAAIGAFLKGHRKNGKNYGND